MKFEFISRIPSRRLFLLMYMEPCRITQFVEKAAFPYGVEAIKRDRSNIEILSRYVACLLLPRRYIFIKQSTRRRKFLSVMK